MRFRVGTLLVAILATMLMALPVAAHANDVRADTQISPDGTVVVETAFIAGDGWLVLHMDDNGNPGSVIGYTRLSGEEGFQTDVTVPVDDSVWARQEGAIRLWVALHGEGGDEGFSPDEDTVIESFGRPVTDRFALKKGDRAFVTARQFAPQEVSKPVVTIRRAVLPREGYLVVHNASDGQLVGVSALEAGSHANVSVALNESFFKSRSQGRLNATLYVDDGNGKFDQADEPIRVDGDPVRTTFGFRNTVYTDEPAAATEAGDATAAGSDTGGSASATTGSPSATERPVVVTASSTRSGSTPTDTGQPGFGLVAAVIALTTAVLGARRRA